MDGNFVGDRPRIVKIQLERFGTSSATSGIVAEWTQFVSEPSMVNGQAVFTNHIYIPTDGSILPGTFGINIKNVKWESRATGISEHFTITGSERAVSGRSVIIDTPGSGRDEWLVEDEHSIRWSFDRTLGNIIWSVLADQGNDGSQVFTVPQDAIRVMNNGTAIARFTLPRRFGTADGSRNRYANIKVIGRIASGTGLARSISAQTVVKVSRSIELISPDNRTQRLSMQDDSRYRVTIRNNRSETIHVIVILKNWSYTRTLKTNMALSHGLNSFDWCIFCEITDGSHKDLTGNGYQIIVQKIDDPEIFEQSTTFAIIE